MTLDTRQLRTLIGRFRAQHALEVGARGLFYGGLGSAVVILADKIRPFPTSWDPGFLALGVGAGLGVLAGACALLKRYQLEDAARAIDAHYGLQELLGSAHELAPVAAGEFEAAVATAADRLVKSQNFTRDFRLRPPAYTRQATASMAVAGLLIFVPPLQTLNPAKRAELAELKAREAALQELARDLKEIRKDDAALEELAREVADLAVRSQKQRLTKEDFLRELDEIQKELESRMADLDKEGTAKALESLKESMSDLAIPEVGEAKDLAAQMEALQKRLEKKDLKFDQLDQLEKTLKAQQENLKDHKELNSLNKELGRMREEVLKQQQEKLGGEVNRLLDEMSKEAKEGAQKTPEQLRQQLQQQVQQMQQEARQGQLGQEDTNSLQQKIDQQRQSDPSSATRMQELNDRLNQALSKEQQLGNEVQQQQSQNQQQSQQSQQGQQGQQGEQQQGQQSQQGQQGEQAQQGQQSQQGQQGESGQQPGQQSQQGQSAGEQQSGQGQQGQSGQSPSQQPSQNPDGQGQGQGQMTVEEWMQQQQQSQQGNSQGQGGQPMEGAPQLGPQGQNPGQGQGQGSGQGSQGFSSLSPEEMRNWADMLKEYQGLSSTNRKLGQTRSGGSGKPGEGSGSGGGNGWGLGHDPVGTPSNQGSGPAQSQPGMKTQQSKLTLDQMLDFQALYDPHLIDARIRDEHKVQGYLQEGESGGFTMVKAPNVEEGDAITPYFSVDPKAADAEVQALENQEIPANLKDLVRQYFDSLKQ